MIWFWLSAPAGRSTAIFRHATMIVRRWPLDQVLAQCGAWPFNGYLQARNHIRNHQMAGQH
jgi:hypothetical protein